jgi:hypothetical protein
MRIVTYQEFDVVMGTIMGTLVPHLFLWHACHSTCHLQHQFGAPPLSTLLPLLFFAKAKQLLKEKKKSCPCHQHIILVAGLVTKENKPTSSILVPLPQHILTASSPIVPCHL